jgi:hypothetical protein
MIKAKELKIDVTEMIEDRPRWSSEYVYQFSNGLIMIPYKPVNYFVANTKKLYDNTASYKVVETGKVIGFSCVELERLLIDAASNHGYVEQLELGWQLIAEVKTCA